MKQDFEAIANDMAEPESEHPRNFLFGRCYVAAKMEDDMGLRKEHCFG
jgi:hypothetical protein